jgi:VWFA-related protein
MRSACALVLLLCLACGVMRAQQDDSAPTTLTVRSNLVVVPALVTTKDGHVVFELKPDDFELTDNGVPQRLSLEQDTDSQPLALAVVVETGGAGPNHFEEYQQLDSILDALLGNVDHRIAVIGFDSAPHLLLPFTAETEDASKQLANLRHGDPGAAILDAVAFAIAKLKEQPARYRRAVLLLSETVDQGSFTTLTDAVRLISDTNTMMYTFGFSSTRSAVSHEASKFNGSEPGPAHGCFSKQGADPEYDGHYSKQVLDCISQLAPPIRLATMAFLAARSALHTNTTESIAQLTGGEYVHFKNTKDLKAGLFAVSNDVPNYYVLSFHPSAPTPGMHALHLEVKDREIDRHSKDRQSKDLRHLELKARREYWLEDETKP